jgi:hypothetical protein
VSRCAAARTSSWSLFAEPLDAAIHEVDASGLRSSEPCAATGSWLDSATVIFAACLPSGVCGLRQKRSVKARQVLSRVQLSSPFPSLCYGPVELQDEETCQPKQNERPNSVADIACSYVRIIYR